MSRKSSDITVTDQFCGSGGSSSGASKVPGVRIRMALNHWRLAIDTHNSNFPDTDHDCTDISACDPRRYPSTNILITSPECTNHSLAKGKKRNGLNQRDMFIPQTNDPADERSRATMWDVPRFAEYHEYEFIIVENVPDATRWVQFPAWLHAMKLLGYDHRVLSLNSMFFWPCPQSRDRMYVVFWKDGNAAPDLEFTPQAWCPRCEKDIQALQTWKANSRTGQPNRVGKYDSTGKQNQYFYSCPACRSRVEPYYFCALNAIDLSIEAQRIGDRKRPLRPRTLERIRYGLKKYGNQHLVLRTNMTSGIGCRVRDASDAPLDTQPGSNITALVHPETVRNAFLVHTRQGSGLECRVSDGSAPIGTQTADYDRAVCVPPAILTTAGSRDTAPAAAHQAVPTLTGSDRFGVTLAPSFLSTMRGTVPDQLPSTAEGLDGVLGTVSAGGVHHSLVVNGAALVTLRDMKVPHQLVRGVDEVMGTQVAAGTQDFVLSKGKHLVSYYGQSQASGAGEAIPTLTGLDRHAVVDPAEELSVDDCYFRMLQPSEIQTGMAFDPEYVVLGNKRDKVKQLGNAVTPPVMQWIVGRCVEALEGGRGPGRKKAA